MRICLLLMLLLGVSPTHSANVLILPFDNATGDKSNDILASAVAEILTVCFSQYSEQIVVLDRASFGQGISEQSIVLGGYTATQSAKTIEKGLAVEFILKGSLVNKDYQLQLQALLFNAANTQLHDSVYGRVDSHQMLNSLCSNITKPLLASLADKKAEPNGLKTEDFPEKQQELINGLKHYYNGEFAQAFAPFLKLVKTYPEDPVPHYWLAQSFYRAGLNEFAIIQFQDFINRFQDSRRIATVRSQLQKLQPQQKKEQSNEKK